MVTIVTTIVKCGCSGGGLATISAIIAVGAVLAVVVPAVAAFFIAVTATLAAVGAILAALAPLFIGLAIAAPVAGVAGYAIKLKHERQLVEGFRQRNGYPGQTQRQIREAMPQPEVIKVSSDRITV